MLNLYAEPIGATTQGQAQFDPSDPANRKTQGQTSSPAGGPAPEIQAAMDANQPQAGTAQFNPDPAGYERGRFKDYLINVGKMWGDAELPEQFQYNPNEIDIGEMQRYQAMDFDPMRQQAMGDIQANTSSGLQSALTQQAAAGGLTAADRMALASSFNRQKMGAQADVMGKFGQAEAQNVWETDRLNREMANRAYLHNVNEQNRAQQANIGTLAGMTQQQFGQAADLYDSTEAKKFAEAQQAWV